VGRFDNSAVLARTVRDAKQHLRPPPDLKPSEWAEANIRIPIGNAIPGFIRFDNAPYQREPLDMTISPDCHRITLMWSAQVGKTTVALCAQAYHIAMRPLSQMMMQPSQTDLQVWLNTKFLPLIESSPGIRDRLAKPRGRDGVNNSTMKSYPGGFIMFAWSGSQKTMRGRSAPFIVADEIDGYEPSAEGHAVGLMWQRAATFGDQRKLIEISTPTIKGSSYIEDAFNAGDQRYFYLPCPDCHDFQKLEWEQVTWRGKSEPDDYQDPFTSRYVCRYCGSPWNDGQRIWAVRNAERLGGGWRALKPFRGHASFHLNELYSTLRRLGDIVQSYLDKRATNDMQTFVNVSLALTYEEPGEQANPDNLMARAEQFRAQVPAGGLVLTAGVDMQHDRLEVEVVAWGRGEESWSVDYQVLWGDPLQIDVWDELEALLSSTWQHESGAQLPIVAACVDTGGTGGTTQAAYDWLRGKTGRRIFGTKGVGGWGRPIVSAPSRKQMGKNKRKIDLFLVGVDEAKLTVMRRLAVESPGPGYCHIPADRGMDWCRQLTAEKLVTRYVKGFPVRSWYQTYQRNEALDCRVYALAALKIANPSFKRAAERLQMDVAVENDQEKAPEETELQITQSSQKRAKMSARRRGGWVRNW